MEHKYVLNYFPLPGRAEATRLMFHIKEVKFLDNHIQFSEWPKQKNDTKRFPLGQVPTLEVHGEVICQSGAINRFVAEELGLHGSSSIDKARIAQVEESVSEIQEGWVKIKFDVTKSDETKKVELGQYFGGDYVKQRLKFMEGILKKSAGTFFFGDKPTLADALYYSQHSYAINCNPSVMDNYPKFGELFTAFSDLEPIKKYLLIRPYEAKLV